MKNLLVVSMVALFLMFTVSHSYADADWLNNNDDENAELIAKIAIPILVVGVIVFAVVSTSKSNLVNENGEFNLSDNLTMGIEYHNFNRRNDAGFQDEDMGVGTAVMFRYSW